MNALLLLTVSLLQAPLPPVGIHRTAILENDVVIVARLTYDPASREEVHAHPFSAVTVYLTTAELDMTNGKETRCERTFPGRFWFIPKETLHAATNTGTLPFDVITVGLKASPHGYPPEGQAPPVPSGIVRNPVVENAETRVARVTFKPDARETVHSHPFDLVLVQVTPGKLEVKTGEKIEIVTADVGEVLFLPRDVPHAVANAGTSSFELMSIAVK